MSPSSQCENFPIPSPADAFNSVNDILMGLEYKQYEIARAIESLAFNPGHEGAPAPFWNTKDLLLLKATSNATGQCLETAFSLLQDLSTGTRAPAHTPARIKNTGN